MDENESKAKAESAAKNGTDNKPGEDWLKSAIDNIRSDQKEDLEVQPTIDKMEFQTTISRSEYQTSNVPTDRILKRTTERNLVDTPTRPRQNVQSRFLYSLTGLLLGSAIGLAGLLLIIHGMYSANSWLAGIVGTKEFNDMGPGIAILLFGIFLIFFTKEKTPPS